MTVLITHKSTYESENVIKIKTMTALLSLNLVSSAPVIHS